jgi:hypothetical protein
MGPTARTGLAYFLVPANLTGLTVQFTTYDGSFSILGILYFAAKWHDAWARIVRGPLRS